MTNPIQSSQGAWDEQEDLAHPSFEQGQHCPPYTLRLFELAQAVHEGSELTTDELELQHHLNVHQCTACRTIFDGAMSSLRWDTNQNPGRKIESDSGSVGWELSASREELLECLRNAQQMLGYRELSFVNYIEEVGRASGLSEGSLIRALNLSRVDGIQVLNGLVPQVKDVAALLGLKREFVFNSVLRGCVNDHDHVAVACLEKLGGDSNLDVISVCNSMKAHIEELEGTDGLTKELIRACRQKVEAFFAD